MHGGVRRGLSKNRKERNLYLQDLQAHTVRLSVMQKRSFSASQNSLQQHQGSPTNNSGTQLVWPFLLSNVKKTDLPHSPLLPTMMTTSRPSSRVSGKFASPTDLQSNSLRSKPPHLLPTSATMPIHSASSLPLSPKAPHRR